jgi:hypothetical protein
VTHADLSGLAERGHPWNEIVVDGRGERLPQQPGFRLPRRRVRPWNYRAAQTGRVGAAGRRRYSFPQRDGGHARQFDADRGRVLRPGADRVPDRRRRQPVPAAGVGGPRRRRAGRYLPRRRGSRLVRRRSQPAVRARPGPGRTANPARRRALVPPGQKRAGVSRKLVSRVWA